MSMRWLITGANGMVGTDLRFALKRRGEDTIAVGREELDITDADAVRRIISAARPSVIVNCAAFTRVDDCETREADATEINGEAVAVLADAANRARSLLVQLSTDFVFDGGSRTPYEIDEPCGPLSAYGRSKLRGEEAARAAAAHVVVRTSWLFGVHGWNFVEAIRRQIAGGGLDLAVVDDQLGRPTYTPHLADAIIRIAARALSNQEARGTFHYADAPAGSWFDFATEIVSQLKASGEAAPDVFVRPVTSDAFPRPARRPPYSVLSTDRYEQLTGTSPESWQKGLTDYLERRPAPAEG